MARLPIRVRRRRTDKEPTPVPAWFTDTEHLSPCPCGEEPDATVIVVNGSAGLERWIHRRCFDWLECEMDEEEIERKREWEKRMREDEDESSQA